MHLDLAAKVECQTCRLHKVAEAANVEGAVVAMAEEGVVVMGQEQRKVKVEVEATEGTMVEVATKHMITHGKVKTRCNRQITIESEDTTKK